MSRRIEQFFTLNLQSPIAEDVSLPNARRFHETSNTDWNLSNNEQRLQELSWERKAETERVERLSATGGRRKSAVKTTGLAARRLI